jgi:hypothetical protein
MLRVALGWAFLMAFLFATGQVLAQAPVSGPTTQTTPALKVFDATGPNTASEVDYTADRKGKPTVYLFVAADKWDRPVARFIKTLDTEVAKEIDDGYLVAVWLTTDAEKTKEYLPRAQQSMNLQRTALTCYLGDKGGPQEWSLDPDAHLTAVVSHEGKVIKSV